MSTQADRLRKIVNVYNSSLSAFEKQCGLSNGTITLPIRQNKNLSTTTISKICYTFPVNEQWLTSGEGEPFKNILSFQDNILKILFEENTNIKIFEQAAGFKPNSFKLALSPQAEYEDILVWGKRLKKLYPNHDYSWLYKDPDTTTQQTITQQTITQQNPQKTQTRTLDSGEKVKTNLFLPGKLMKYIKLLAYAEKTTVGGIITKVLEEYVNKPENINKIYEAALEKVEELKDIGN